MLAYLTTPRGASQHGGRAGSTQVAAAAGATGVAAAGEGAGYLVGDLARALHDVGIRVTERNQPTRSAEVVAPGVSRALALWVRLLPVELDDHPVLLVANVLVPEAPGDQRLTLAVSLWQAVRPLHLVQVAVFQNGLDTDPGVAERREQDLPPPHARASVQRGQQLLRCGPPAGAGVEDPCGRPGSRSLHLGKIKDSLVKPGPRRLQRRMTRGIHPARVGHHDSAHGGHDAPSARHDVDRAALPGLQ